MSKDSLSTRGPSANTITAELLIEIPKRFPNIRVWRANRIDALAVGKGGRLRRVQAGQDGQGDILGIIGPNGLFLSIEVKAGKDRMLDSQWAYRQMVLYHGGVYLVAKDVEQCIEELRRWVVREVVRESASS